MKRAFLVASVCSAWFALLAVTALAADVGKPEDAKSTGTQLKPIRLWPGIAPGDKPDMPEERDTTQHDPKVNPKKEVIRLGNVSQPMITVFQPPKAKNTGAAVVVCPGGGYSILAYDLEGTEVCDWLNSIGVTGVLLKYRVPGRGGERYTAPLQDAQRALGLVREHATEWGIDPKRVGILGFSAGGHLAAAASTNYQTRTYPPIDGADKLSCRPDFTILIYPAYLVKNNDVTQLAPELKVTANTPPAFIVMTEDDPVKVENAYGYALALKSEKVGAEVHTYPTGGHGYGLRPSANEVSTWPLRAAEWLDKQGWLKAK
ncbi:MAG TPA: alpha/beta hydrolase [Pirellulales bacterium]|jgi:acetyl esterase/lipase|nr:alpha/beta hydrolase [Pirellulales bacterium]